MGKESRANRKHLSLVGETTMAEQVLNGEDKAAQPQLTHVTDNVEQQLKVAVEADWNEVRRLEEQLKAATAKANQDTGALNFLTQMKQQNAGVYVTPPTLTGVPFEAQAAQQVG